MIWVILPICALAVYTISLQVRIAKIDAKQRIWIDMIKVGTAILDEHISEQAKHEELMTSALKEIVELVGESDEGNK